jgi:transcriptional regulator with XRE-family HTH domain
VTTDPGSTVPRRQLGRYLRQLREDARITVKLAAEQLEWSAPKIWRIEGGATSMRALDVEAMCRLYGATPDRTQALMALARETKSKGWWHDYGDVISPSFELYVGLETAANRLRQYEPELIPGLLQTEAYAMEVFRIRDRHLTDEEVSRRVAVRKERQELLTRTWPTAPKLEIVLNEGVLRRPLRNRGEMADQLRHITKAAALPNVSVHVLPFATGIHPAAMAGGPFVILDFPDNGDVRGAEPTTVYSDGLTGSLYLDKPVEVDAYCAVWAEIIKTSLNEVQSRKLIATIAKEYPSP